MNEYGTPDPSKYLQKFINLWVSLPKVQISDERTTKVYLRYCLKQMQMEAKNQNETDWALMFEELVVYYNLSLRDIERSLTNFSLIRIVLKDRNINYDYRWICAYLSVIKVIYPHIYKQIAISHIDYPILFEKTNLDALHKDWIFSEQPPENHNLKWLLRYCLANDEQARELLSKGNYLSSGHMSNRQTAIKDICMWLDSFRIN